MKKIISGSLVVAAALAIAGPSYAETFEGPYAGIQAGWDRNKVGSAETDIGKANIDRSRDAVAAGIFAGYNYKAADKIVLSAEAAFNVGFDDRITRYGRDTLSRIDPDYAFDLGIRAGYLVTDTTLVYVRGGYENMRASVRLVDGATSRHGKDTFDGWSVGGGVERALTDRISARVEYRYSDLGRGSTSFERHQALVGVAYHF